jgi:hypothetical protein
MGTRVALQHHIHVAATVCQPVAFLFPQPARDSVQHICVRRAVRTVCRHYAHVAAGLCTTCHFAHKRLLHESLRW